MKVQKRYACHRVYDGYDHFHSQSVVAINAQGEVLDCKPLVHETSFTEWIGGVIVLSPLTDVDLSADFQTMLRIMTATNQLPLYAWHISEFDFSKEMLTSRSIVRRL